jgi:hypothetical protein
MEQATDTMSSSAGSGATDSPSDRDGRKTRSDTYWGLASPPFAAHNKSMRVRMRKQPSDKKLSIPSPDKLVGKLLHFDKARSTFGLLPPSFWLGSPHLYCVY